MVWQKVNILPLACRSNTELMRVVDNLIADGKMEPMIIITPTWYNTDPWSPDRQSEDMFSHQEFP